jgi:4-hydroxybenzoate polyprenyltransferase
MHATVGRSESPHFRPSGVSGRHFDAAPSPEFRLGSAAETPQAVRSQGVWRDYVRIARPDHWVKNIFVLPGVLVALMVLPEGTFTLSLVPWVMLGLVSACLAASANYVINEYLDAEFDRHHPTKKRRPCVSGRVTLRDVLLEYALLIVAGLGLAAMVGTQFLAVSVTLLVMGVLYNVRPIRTKDWCYLDVISESVNNPLRFLLGWSTILGHQLPPSSILITYWMGGAFLMGIKRFAEYRSIGNPKVAGLYRRSFQYYSEKSLLLSSFFYALVSAFFLAVFLIKYRIEFLLTFPLFALLFTWYLAIGMQRESAAQAPERLFRERGFMVYVMFLAVVVVVLFYVDLPWLRILLEQSTYKV